MTGIFTLIDMMGTWGWLSFGLILMILELIIPGTFIIWFGLGAVLTGICVGLMTLTAPMQLTAFIVFSTISVFFGFFVYKRLFGANKDVGTQDRTGAQKYIGQSFKVVEAIEDGSGKVAVGDTVWLAKSKHHIAKGKRAKVVAVEGTILVVE